MSERSAVKVSVFIAASLDGYIARPDGDIAWLHAGDPLPEGDDAGYSVLFNAVDALVMGRGTFEKVLTFGSWPYGTKPVIVLSRSLQTIPDHLPDTVEIIASAPADLLEELAQRDYKHIYLDGGQVIQAFLRSGLVDEMTITTIPRLIGAGRPLFGALPDDVLLRHIGTRTWANSFVQTTYQVLPS